MDLVHPIGPCEVRYVISDGGIDGDVRVAVRIVAGPTTVSRVLEQPDVSPDLLLITSRPFHHKPAVSESRRALLQLVVETNSFGAATPLHFFQAGACSFDEDQSRSLFGPSFRILRT